MYLMLGISREGWGQGKVSDPGMFLVELIISETSLKGLEKKQFPKANSRNKRSKMEERKKLCKTNSHILMPQICSQQRHRSEGS